MDTTDRIALLEQILATSREIRTHIEAGDWTAGLERNEQRDALIRRCFAPPGGFSDPAAAASMLREILDLDGATLRLAQQSRGELGVMAGRLRQGRAAAAAYRQHEG
jgi:hypothetical protein